MYLDSSQAIAYQPSTSEAKHVAAFRKEAKLEDRRRRKTNPVKQGLTVVHRLRVKDVEKLIEYRHNGGPCDTDDGVWLDVLIPSFQQLAIGRKGHAARVDRIWQWANIWVPRVAQERGETWFEAKMQTRPQWLSPDKFAKMLRITDDEVKELELGTKVSMTRPKAVRDVERKTKDAERHRTKRQANGATPRSDSMERQKPWKDLGISRRTYFRRQEKDRVSNGTGSSTSL